MVSGVKLVVCAYGKTYDEAKQKILDYNWYEVKQFNIDDIEEFEDE